MRQPFQRRGFLPRSHLHKLRGLPLQLDLFRIDHEQLRPEVTNARANLPAHQRILIRRIIPDQQHCLRLIQLLHREQGISGPVAKRRDQPGIIHGPVMVDVVRSKRRARHPLQQIILFIRSAVRTDESNRIFSAGVVNRLQLCRCRLRRLFPRNGIKFVAFANHRLPNALRVRREIKTKAALHAQKIFVNSTQVAVIRTQNLVIAHAQRRLAAVRAMRANRGNIRHLPRPRFVTIRPARQRAHRTNINAHPAFFAFQVILAIRNNHAVRAAHPHAQRLDVHAFITHAHATETQDASRSIVINKLRPFFLGPVNFLFHKPAGIRAVAEYHVLQLALAAFVADRAIQRMIGQQKLQHVLARVANLLRVRSNDHAFRGDDRARCLQLRRLFDFHQAHPARRLQRQPGVVAKRRHFRADPARCLDQQRARRHLHFAVVDLQLDKLLFWHGFLTQFLFVVNLFIANQPALRPICARTGPSNVPQTRSATSS